MNGTAVERTASFVEAEAIAVADDVALDLDAEDHDTTPPPSSHPRTIPPPLPESASRVPASRLAADDALAEQMMERLAAGDYLGALLASETLLEYRPFDADASDTAQMARSELRKIYVARLGSLERVPHLGMPLEGMLSATATDARTAFVLARVDDVATVREIVEAAGMPATDALRVLSELRLRRAIVFDD